MKSFAVCLLSLLASVSAASAEAPTVSGQVRLADGSAVAGASVVLFDVEGLGVVAKATTDESGQFALAPRGAAADAARPVGFSLGQNYPNPFNPATIIPYELAATASVRLEVFNVLGQRVMTLVDGEQAPGHHAVEWDGRDASGQGVGSGVYIYRLTVGSTRSAARGMATGRMVLVDGAAGSAAGGGPGAGTLDALDAPAGSAVAAPMYGLAVYEAGIATFVDLAFVGSGPVEVVVVSSSGSGRRKAVVSSWGVGRGKAAAQQSGPGLIQWSLEDVDLLDPAGLEYVAQAVNEQIKQVCPSATSEIGFAHQDDFLVSEMSIPTYECLSGLDTDANEALGEGSVALLTDAILGLAAVAITVLGTALAAPVSLALTIYSAVGDVEFLTNYGSAALEKVFPRSTRVGLLGDFVSDVKIGTGRSYTPVLMVKHESDAVRMIDLKLRTEYTYFANCTRHYRGICDRYIDSETVELGRLTVHPARGYFVIPAQTVSFNVVNRSREGIFLNKDRRFQLSMNSWRSFWFRPLSDFWDGETTLEVAKFVPQFTFATGSSSFGDLVFLDADASVLPADGVPAYEWFYQNRRIGAGSTLIVRQSSFAELADGRGAARVQLQVTIGRSVETETQVVQLGEPAPEEPVEPPVEEPGPDDPDAGGGSTGTVQTFTHSLGGDESVSLEFVWIEPGTFMMGSPDTEPGRQSDEGPVHEVEISRGFWLGRFEVTQGEWEAVMGNNPSHYTEDSRLPVERVSWYDVHEFVGRLNDAAGDSLYRLPTEAEWEYACRAGTTTRWSLGDEDGNDESLLGKYAWYSGNNSPYGTKVVGGRLPNRWGLYDMHGNVWEWVQDWYDSSHYSVSPSVDPPGPIRGSYRVFRGGDFDGYARGVRSAGRYNYSPGSRYHFLGARLLRTSTP